MDLVVIQMILTAAVLIAHLALVVRDNLAQSK